MEFHLTRLRDRRATVDGGEDCDAYFCPTTPRSSVVLMRVVRRNPGIVMKKGNQRSKSKFWSLKLINLSCGL
ncbi:hypothetical protein C0J52_26672 [Blattella germanica]|nr:hypothetical protein C0J52_26672 [Blattella germanica]